MKQTEDGDGLILRLVEVDGVATTARVAFAPELLPKNAVAVEADTMEWPLSTNSARIEENTVAVELPAFGITAVRIG